MAGAGKKTFTAGEVLTASDVNTYLMEQSVMNFAGTAARASAIPTPSEGMVSYRSDTDNVEFYNGSSWLSVGGEQFITSASFTTQSSIDFTSALTDTYKSYRFYIEWRGSVATGLYLQYKATSSNIATGYYAGGNFGSSLGSTGSHGARDGVLSYYICDHATSGSSQSVMTITRASSSTGTLNAVGFDNQNAYGWHLSGGNVGMTGFDGFRVFPLSGTITGTYTLTGIKF
jgi:hypothetical protein